MDTFDIQDKIRGSNIDERSAASNLVIGIEDELYKLKIKSKELEHLQKEDRKKGKIIPANTELDQDLEGLKPDIWEIRNLRRYVDQKSFNTEKDYYRLQSRKYNYRNILGSQGTEIQAKKDENELMRKMKGYK